LAIYDINGNPVSGTGLDLEARQLNLHLMPKTRGELNMVKRARQLTDIKWTPAATIKRKNVVEYDEELNWSQWWQDTFIAGTEYKGIPYSHGYYSGGYRTFAMLGYEVPIDAFATSVQFANSYFSVTDRWDASSGIYTAYGATCDTLVCYAMGLEEWKGSNVGFQELVDAGTIVLQFNSDNIAQNVDNVHLGDILWKKEVHVAIITDLVIDDNNDVFVEVCEATTKGATKPDENGLVYGGVCRRELWNLEDFLSRFYGYGVYRYRDSANVKYEQNPFVQLDGEAPLHNLRSHAPLIPYMGEKFKYRSGYIPNTNILLATSSYDYLAVYKDGALFNTFTVNSASSIATGFSAVGEYEAFLYNSSDGTIANMTNRTVSCHWSVVS